MRPLGWVYSLLSFAVAFTPNALVETLVLDDSVSIRILHPKPGSATEERIRVHLNIAVGEGTAAENVRSAPHMYQVRCRLCWSPPLFSYASSL